MDNTNGNQWDDNGNPISGINVETNKDEYICPSGYVSTPKPMGLSSMEVCEDAYGNTTTFTNGKKWKT